MSDSKTTVVCPACGNEMKKIFIESANCNVDICVDGCGGIFFDNREFKKFDEQHENIDEILEAYKGKTYKKEDERKERICPVCGAVMVKHDASSKNEVEMDECYSCGAIFLDYGELQAIREQFSTEEERSKAFQKMFESVHDISEFKDYKSKTTEELFGKKLAKFINIINKLS